MSAESNAAANRSLDADIVAAPVLARALGDNVVRRGSPFVSPESARLAPNSRESTPHRVTYESLSRRPRSNQRNRTPMRYESPLNPDAFRRDEASPERREGQRVTVRPLAGAAVGTTLGGRRLGRATEERSVTPLSSKQGPSQRKVRRWNNDNFVGLASELANASSRGPAVAEVLLKAQADAPLYLSVYNPEDFPQSTVSRFMENDELKGLRDEFFRGEIGDTTSYAPTRMPAAERELTPQAMLNRIHGRLRKVVARACSSSQGAVKIVDAYETFLVQCFESGNITPLDELASGSLLETPVVTETRGRARRVVVFSFDAESSSGGFHRLLLHAVAQFHGLNAVSKTINKADDTSARLLTVAGKLTGSNFRLSEQVNIAGLDSCSQVSSVEEKIQALDVSQATESLSALHV